MARTRSVNSIISEFLFRVLLVLGVFDGVRSWMVIIGGNLSILKELVTLSLLLLLLLRNKFRLSTPRLIYSNFFLAAYLATIALFTIVFNDYTNIESLSIFRPDQPNKYIIHFKTIEAFIIIYLFLNYRLLTDKEIFTLMPFFVKLSVMLVVLTLFVYFIVDLSWLFEAHWDGRISIGYPPADAQILCFALAYLLFAEKPFTNLYNIIYIIILTTGILMNATGTGLLSLIFIFLFYFFISFTLLRIKRIFRIRNILFIILLIGAFNVVTIALNNRTTEVDKFIELFEGKFKSVSSQLLNFVHLSNSSPVLDRSVEIRNNQIAISFTEKKDIISLVFGGPISIGTLIENQNFFILRSYGILGIFLYYSWITFFLITSIKNIRYNFGRLMFATVIIIVLSNLSNLTTYMFGLSMSFALLISFSIIQLKNNEKFGIIEAQ